MKRMLDEYIEKYYKRLYQRASMLKADDYLKAIELAEWKSGIIKGWDALEVISVEIPDSTVSPLELGQDFAAEIVVKTNGIRPGDIGIEVIFGQKENDEVKSIILKEELKVLEAREGLVKFGCRVEAVKSGVFDYAFRIYPKNELLPHRQDFVMIRWI